MAKMYRTSILLQDIQPLDYSAWINKRKSIDMFYKFPLNTYCSTLELEVHNISVE